MLPCVYAIPCSSDYMISIIFTISLLCCSGMSTHTSEADYAIESFRLLVALTDLLPYMCAQALLSYSCEFVVFSCGTCWCTLALLASSDMLVCKYLALPLSGISDDRRLSCGMINPVVTQAQPHTQAAQVLNLCAAHCKHAQLQSHYHSWGTPHASCCFIAAHMMPIGRRSKATTL